MKTPFRLNFSEIRMTDVPLVGGKNASLGELFAALGPQGVGVLDGFALTTDAYWHLLEQQNLRGELETLFNNFDAEDLQELASRGHAARTKILQTPFPEDVRRAILDGYRGLVARLGKEPELAVRSSASAEDLPEASFAGAAETFLNVRGEDALLRAVTAGDDYQIAFTAPPELNGPFTRIGRVEAGEGVNLIVDGHVVGISLTGYQHF